MNKEKLLSVINQELTLRPCSTLQDIYKLLRQSLYGPEINTNSKKIFFEEFNSCTPREDQPLTEDITIDKKMLRVNLCRYKAEGLSPDRLFDMFCKSAKKSDMPVLSHSKIYKEKYDPHYRVILKELMDK